MAEVINEQALEKAKPKGRLTLQSALENPGVKARFEQMLGKRSASFLSSVMSAVNSNNELKKCDPMSVVAAAAIAASMDLPINPSLGLAYIVPYRGKDKVLRAQFQLGWKGFVQLALRSGQYKTIHLTPVLEGQIKSHNPFTGEIEFSNEATSDKQIGYLLFFKLLNGYEKYFYMTAEEMRKHSKKYSSSMKKGYGLWVDNFEAMALKTVCKLGLSKYGILSVEMQQAIEADQAEVQGDGSLRYIDNEPVGATPLQIEARSLIDEKYASMESEDHRAAVEALNNKGEVEDEL